MKSMNRGGFYSHKNSRPQGKTPNLTPTGRKCAGNQHRPQTVRKINGPTQPSSTPSHSTNHYRPNQNIYDLSGLDISADRFSDSQEVDNFHSDSYDETSDGNDDSIRTQETGRVVKPLIQRRYDHERSPLVSIARANRIDSSGISPSYVGGSPNFPNSLDIVGLLQEQQVMMQQLLKQQERLQEKQAEFDQKLIVIDSIRISRKFLHI